jgi:hypothetical protein
MNPNPFSDVPGQRSTEHIGYCAFRLPIGIMQWQQSLWKLPPFFYRPAANAVRHGWARLLDGKAGRKLQADFANKP